MKNGRSICLTLCFLLLSPPIVHGTNNGGWLSANGLSVRPFDGENLEHRTWFLYKGKTGSDIYDAIEFWNEKPEAVEIIIESVDATLLDGAFSLRSPTDPGHFLSQWIKIKDKNTEKTTTVEPGGKRIIPFSIHIPENVAKKDYWGGITIREITKHKPAWRVGIRILIRVQNEKSATTERMPQEGEETPYYPELTLYLEQIPLKFFYRLLLFARLIHFVELPQISDSQSGKN